MLKMKKKVSRSNVFNFLSLTKTILYTRHTTKERSSAPRSEFLFVPEKTAKQPVERLPVLSLRSRHVIEGLDKLV